MTAHCLTLSRPVELTEEVVRRHQRGVWRHLRFLGAPPPLADDLCQETFLALLRRPPEDRGHAALRAWLRATARNLFRRSGRALRPGLLSASERELEEAWLRQSGADDGDRWLGALDACLELLAAREREALTRRYVDGQGHEAIAAALGLMPEGAKTLLRRVKERLRECVTRRMQHERS